MQKVYEWCPYCEDENEYEVAEGEWIANCKTCGRPILLCNKCHDHSDCGCCPYDKGLKSATEEWVKNQIGKIVYWKDPDDDICSDWCRVTDVNEDVYVLSHLFYPDGCDSIVEAYASEIDFVDENRQIEVYESFFKSEKYKNGEVTLDNSNGK